MSRGFGTIQRAMLFTLAQHEVGMAETAAELQRPYRSPDRWSLRSLTWGACCRQITERQRAKHDDWNATLTAFRAGDERATEHVKIIANLHSRLRTPLNWDATEFEPSRPEDHELQRFNPSRTIVGLERRGFVLRDRYRRIDNLALTVAGFVEARRLGGVAESEIVDLDRVQASWREPDDFWLGFTGLLSRDDDADAIRWRMREGADEGDASSG